MEKNYAYLQEKFTEASERLRKTVEICLEENGRTATAYKKLLNGEPVEYGFNPQEKFQKASESLSQTIEKCLGINKVVQAGIKNLL